MSHLPNQKSSYTASQKTRTTTKTATFGRRWLRPQTKEVEDGEKEKRNKGGEIEREGRKEVHTEGELQSLEEAIPNHGDGGHDDDDDDNDHDDDDGRQRRRRR